LSKPGIKEEEAEEDPPTNCSTTRMDSEAIEDGVFLEH
jgi:hypothetical protein